MSSVPVLWVGFHGFHLGQHLQVDGVAFPVDLFVFNELDNLAGRLFAVLAVPEAAGVHAGFFKTGKVR